MNVLVTGATGVIGHQAVPRLLQAGHDLAGVARSAAAAGWLRAVGAEVFGRAAGWDPRYPRVAAGRPTVGTEHRRSA
jgi:uncharacterized protein YbjT (DUF2867 family)